jgi:hypothetical protein
MCVYLLNVHHPSWRLSTRYKSMLPQRDNQSQLTFLFVLLLLLNNKRTKSLAVTDYLFEEA